MQTMSRVYAREITKEYLQSLGITDVKEDGTIFRKSAEMKQQMYSKQKGYTGVIIWSPEEHKCITLGTHVVVYTWFNNIKPYGLVVDHIDSNPKNNHLSNLQLLTPQQNLTKEKGNRYSNKSSQRQLSRLNTLEQIESKIAYYNALNEFAKKIHDADRAHKYRASLANWKAKKQLWEETH